MYAILQIYNLYYLKQFCKILTTDCIINNELILLNGLVILRSCVLMYKTQLH